MKKMKIRWMGLIGIMIIGLLIVLAPGAWAAPQKPAPEKPVEKTSQTTAVLTALEDRVSQGDQLFIFRKDKPFDPQPTAYTISFPTSANQTIKQNPEAVLMEGQALSLKVPFQAQSGEVTVRKGEDLVGKVKIQITEASVAEWWINLIMGFSPGVIFILFLIWLGRTLRSDTNWNIGDALSESEPLKVNGNVIYRGDNKTLGPQFANSASRLIAFMGFFVIIIWSMGVTMPFIYRYARTGELSDLTGFYKYMAAQAAIFAPYIANRIGAAIKGS